MEDIRDAAASVAEFARLIDELRPNSYTPAPLRERADLFTSRADADNASQSAKTTISTIGTFSIRWRSRSSKKSWDETPGGALWNELEEAQNKVARDFDIDETALKEFVSAPEMMALGDEFTLRYFHDQDHGRDGGPPAEKASWAAEDLFFDLQAVKQGDAEAARWTGHRTPRRRRGEGGGGGSGGGADWDLAHHLARFVLLADRCRLRAGREDWAAWQWPFVGHVAFFLAVLGCYTTREAKRREIAPWQAPTAARRKEREAQD
ncbi:hypothetical protein F4802DRAFT_618904 [Xylaria palmicola]|nr:hypothetical protein F4802DRAFT_618904 [Xylaria palmicola]